MSKNARSGKRTVKADIIFIAAVLLLALVLFGISRLRQTGGAYVTVTVDGKETARYSLSEDGIYALNGGSNTLVISDGKAQVTEANCPDGLCIHQGAIQYTGQTIVCLPNKLIVTVYGADEAPVDIVS